MTKVRASEPRLKYTWHNSLAEHATQPDNCRTIVVGVGGAGNNTVTRLTEMKSKRTECIAINTDASHLRRSKANKKLLIGQKLTRGLGVGGDPKLGRAAVEESRQLVEDTLSGADIVFVTAGLGGGTGAGAGPVVAKIARRKGAVTVGVVTMPFSVEKGRMECATEALNEMRRQCDTVVVIDNDKLMELVPHLPMSGAFKVADQVLAKMIKGFVETISAPSLINLDFTDFKTIVKRGGMAAVSVGESDAPNRAEEAVRNALRTPLVDADYTGATGALIHVAGDSQMTIEEANRVGEIVTEMMDGNAMVIWGAGVNPEQEGKLKVTLVMTGVNPPRLPGGLGAVAPQLFNMEQRSELEKPLGIDLPLYQMENLR